MFNGAFRCVWEREIECESFLSSGKTDTCLPTKRSFHWNVITSAHVNCNKRPDSDTRLSKWIQKKRSGCCCPWAEASEEIKIEWVRFLLPLANECTLHNFPKNQCGVLYWLRFYGIYFIANTLMSNMVQICRFVVHVAGWRTDTISFWTSWRINEKTSDDLFQIHGNPNEWRFYRVQCIVR